MWKSQNIETLNYGTVTEFTQTVGEATITVSVYGGSPEVTVCIDRPGALSAPALFPTLPKAMAFANEAAANLGGAK